MELMLRIALIITGIINLIPSLLAFMPSKIENSYGVALPDANFELLIRHRAVLFSIVGGLMLYSAITKQYYSLATIVGLISMVSYLVLYLIVGKINAELTKVMEIDVFAVVILLIAFILNQFF